jgi:hypothetical protein
VTDNDVPLPRGLWESTRERMWADQWWQETTSISDTARHLDREHVPLGGLAPSSSRVEPVRERTTAVALQIQLRYVTDDGAAIADLPVRIYDGFGFDRHVRTDAEGRIALDVDLDAPHHVELAEIPDLAKIPRLDPPVRSSASPIRRDDLSPHLFSPGKAYDVVIARDRAELVSLDGWHEGGAVLLFGAARTQENRAVSVRAILRTALEHRRPNGMLLVIGHTDTKGKQSDNEALAKERATSVLLYLAGLRTEWAAHACTHATVADLQAALAWASTTGISCDPGPVDNDWGPATAKGLEGFRLHVGIPLEQQLGLDDWAAIYDHYDYELERLLYCRVGYLDVIKESLRPALVGDSYGEQWPAIAPNENGYLCPANRRVDLVWCDVQQEPLESFEEIYDGTYNVRALEVGPEVGVKIHCVMPELAPVPGALLRVRVGMIETGFIADEAGLVNFTALRGEPVEVLRCTDIFGACDLVLGLAKDFATVKGMMP